MTAILEQLDARATILLLIGVAMLVATSIFSYVVWPQFKNYQGAVLERTLLKGELATKRQVGRDLESVRREVEAISRELKDRLVDLPAPQLAALVMSRLQEVCWNNQVELAGVTPVKGRVEEGFDVQAYDVQIAGSYANLFQWVQDVVRELRFISIDRFVIKPLDAESVPPRLSMEMTLVALRG